MELPEARYFKTLQDRGKVDDNTRRRLVTRDQLIEHASESALFDTELLTAILKDVDARLKPASSMVFLEKQGLEGNKRQFATILSVVDKKSGKIVWQYLLKQAENTNDCRNSTEAAKLRLGPRVLYTDEGYRERGRIAEDYFSQEWNSQNRKLTATEAITAGTSIADKLHRMVSSRLIHADKRIGHTFFIGEGKSIEVFFVDWGKVTQKKISELEVDDVKPTLNFAFHILGKQGWQAFKNHLLKEATRNERRIYCKALYGKNTGKAEEKDKLMEGEERRIEDLTMLKKKVNTTKRLGTRRIRT